MKKVPSIKVIDNALLVKDHKVKIKFEEFLSIFIIEIFPLFLS